MNDLCEVVITAPDHDWLAEFARRLIVERLCASAHNFAPIRSTYQWKGKIYDREEGRVSLHTRKCLVAKIVERTRDEHPYEVPSVSTRPIEDGNPNYLNWIREQTREC